MNQRTVIIGLAVLAGGYFVMRSANAATPGTVAADAANTVGGGSAPSSGMAGISSLLGSLLAPSQAPAPVSYPVSSGSVANAAGVTAAPAAPVYAPPAPAPAAAPVPLLDFGNYQGYQLGYGPAPGDGGA